MIITKENEKFYLMALRVDFLTERWERELYTKVLMSADEWGKKVDRENGKYFSKSHIVNKYNNRTKN